MERQKRQLLADFVFVLLSLTFAFYILSTGRAHNFMVGLGDLKFLGIFLSGLFFTSVFTTAPAIVLLAQFSEVTPMYILVPIGAFGAVVGDCIIFKLVRNRIAEDLRYIISFSKYRRLPKIFKTKLFHYFLPFLGSLIIASPFPNELGVAILGLSKVSSNQFYLISFIFNSLAILLIGIVAGYV